MSFLSLRRYKVASFAIGAAFFAAFVHRKLDRAGITRTVVPLNNQDCFTVPGLEACEDVRWVDDESGLAYLVCSSREDRVHWVPATLHLNASQLPPTSDDYIALFDLSTRTHKRLALEGLPASSTGIYVHGLALYRSPANPSHLTLFLNSHRPPADRSLAPTQGADSVIEIFETQVGSDSARWVKTVRHPLVRTPNSIAAVGERQFYFSNDHRYKQHWSRKWETIKSVPSDIIYCDASGSAPECIVAADQVIYPNGIAKGPGNLLYQASTLEGLMRVWKAEADHTLTPVEEVYINRHFDNVHVASDGGIYLTALTKVFDFMAAGKDAGLSGLTPAVEVFRVREAAEKKDGKRYRSELVFADTGEIVSASTSAAPYQDKLLLTGLYSKEVVVCSLK